MKRHVFTAGLLALSLGSAGIAQAQPPGAAAVMQACSTDFQKYCPDAKPGPGGGLKQCVIAHFSDLTAPCKQALMSMRNQHQQQGGATNSTAPAPH